MGFCITLGESVVAGEGGSEGEKGAEQLGVAFVAESETAVAKQPGDGGLHLPAVPAQPSRGVDAAAGEVRGNTAVAEPGAQMGVVVSLVGVQLVGSTTAGSAAGPDCWDG